MDTGVGVASSCVWLEKSLCGSGGWQVSRIGQASGTISSGRYIQQYIAGMVLGAHFVCTPQPRLLGLTASFQSDDWPGPSEFIYRGSWGPIQLEEFGLTNAPELTERLLKTADALQRISGIRGWLQLDLALDAAGQLWLLEVNPRWSAGMEVLVDSGGENPVTAHLAAFGLRVPRNAAYRSDDFPTGFSTGFSAPRLSAKAIVYADHPTELTPARLAAWQHLEGLADIPAPCTAGEIIQPGHPIATVKASLESIPHQPAQPPEVLRQRLLAILHQRSSSLWNP